MQVNSASSLNALVQQAVHKNSQPNPKPAAAPTPAPVAPAARDGDGDSDGSVGGKVDVKA